jgi:cytochrome c553
MKGMARFIFLAMLFGESGCRDLERSRAIDNPAVAGRTIAQQVCSNCHGVNGASVSPTFPRLAGQSREYLIGQLTDFKTHRRSDPNAIRYMWGFTHLSEAQIEELATYFSRQAPPQGDPGDRLLVEKGRTIFASGRPDKGLAACRSCHGMHGEGTGGTPRLAGQHADYIVKQLLVFRHSGQRPRGASMKEISDKMSEQDMHSVAAYLAALSPTTAVPTDQSAGDQRAAPN